MSNKTNKKNPLAFSLFPHLKHCYVEKVLVEINAHSLGGKGNGNIIIPELSI